jgi:dihydroorotate dehydrogenase
MYTLVRNILFKLEAEKAHYVAMNLLKTACSIAPLRWILEQAYTPADTSLERECMGLQFRNPVGLGAGFDKNALYLRELKTLGFGFVEVGTVTPLPQKGNPKPRLFRLPQDKALINRMGFNNDGLEAIKKRLEAWRNSEKNKAYQKPRMIIGGNIGKNKSTPNEDAWKDYVTCFNALFDVVDYFTVNVSSPNTPGLRELQDKDALTKILVTLQELNNQKKHPKPILLKIAPDLTAGQLEDIANIAATIQLDGIVTSNTTISREGLSPASQQLSTTIGNGGLSGQPLKTPADAVLQQLATLTKGKTVLIASGGIFQGADAVDKINYGAKLVQVWTGFIYEGPMLVSKICKELSKKHSTIIQHNQP